MAKGTVLLVDDEANVRSALARLIRPLGFDVLDAENGEHALRVIEETSVDAVITDMRMPVMDGADLLHTIAERWPGVVRILLTGYADLARTRDAIQNGWTDYFLTKPWEPEQVEECIEGAFRGRKSST